MDLYGGAADQPLGSKFDEPLETTVHQLEDGKFAASGKLTNEVEGVDRYLNPSGETDWDCV